METLDKVVFPFYFIKYSYDLSKSREAFIFTLFSVEYESTYNLYLEEGGLV